MTLDAFPEQLMLAPHRRVLARGPAARQFGLDPRGAVTVEALPAEIESLVDALGGPTVSVEWVGRAAELGVPSTYSVALLEGLVERGVLVDAEVVRRRRERRAAARVAVHGDGPLTALVAVGLARSGIGTVQVLTRGAVEPEDVAAGGYAPGDVGRERGPVLRAMVGACGASTTAGPRPDLLVAADAIVVGPALTAALHADRVDHLPVMLREGVGVVGPMVAVGRSPCLGCVELGRADADPGWPTVAAQLVGRSGSAEAETVAAVAALGVAQALVHLDGDARPPAWGTALEVDLHSAVLRRTHWPPHPRCPCGLAAPGRAIALAGGVPERDAAHVGGVACARAAGRETIMG